MPRFTEHVDRVWAEAFGIPVGRLHDKAVRVVTDADVGLVTHPDHRGRGHGLRLALDMTTAALDHTDVVRYRALATNHASLAVAARAGFEPYGENVALRNLTP